MKSVFKQCEQDTIFSIHVIHISSSATDITQLWAFYVTFISYPVCMTDNQYTKFVKNTCNYKNLENIKCKPINLLSCQNADKSIALAKWLKSCH